MLLQFIPVAGETDTTPVTCKFDEENNKLVEHPSPYAEFYEDDLSKLANLNPTDSAKVWSHASDVTYQVTRIY